MLNLFRNNFSKAIACVGVIIVVPIAIFFLSTCSIFSSNSNDWLGFWGSYIAAISGAGVAIYVLFKTLSDNKREQNRKEIVEFCNCITEKSSLFAQRYEEALYEAHTYLVVHENKSATAEQEYGMYKQFIVSHHSAKALLYEIRNYLNIRRDNSMFDTSQFEDVIEGTITTYRVFKNFESEVGRASGVADVNDEKVIKVVENFLEMLRQYQKELIDEKGSGDGIKMKTLEDIYNEVNNREKTKHREEVAKSYISKLRAEIDGDKAKLLVYKEACIKKVDINIPTFWMSTLASVLAILSVMFSVLVKGNSDLEGLLIIVVLGMFIFILIIPILYYTIVVKERNRYLLINLIIEEIEYEMNKDGEMKGTND